MTALLAGIAEAWAELRHHKLRVLLSLIGIAVSVGAIAVVLAIGDYMRQSTVENSDRYGGREATISVAAYRSDGAAVDWDGFDALMSTAGDRFGFTQVTRRADYLSAPTLIQATDYLRPVETQLIDPAYPTIHRSAILAGRWFTETDQQWLAPPVVVSESLWRALGEPSPATFPTVELSGKMQGTFRLVGVTPAESAWDTSKRVILPASTYLARAGLDAQDSMSWEIWVDPARVDQIGPELAATLRAGVPAGTEVSVNRSDWGSRPENQQQAQMFELITGLIAGLVLLLGGLGLVNIQLVAMRQRIREIGVRRSFGASGGRIFATVLLENVVATAVAGVVGIALAIITMRILYGLNVLPTVEDIPPFPLRAALVAMAAAVGIGALAGFLPALTAVRVKVIDALRF